MVMMKKTAPIKPMMPPKPMPKPPEMETGSLLSQLGEKLKSAKLEHHMRPDMAENMGRLMAKDPAWMPPSKEQVKEWLTDLQFKIKDSDDNDMISEQEFGIEDGFFKVDNLLKRAEFNKKDWNDDGMLSRDEFGGVKAMAHLENCMPPSLALPIPSKMDGFDPDFAGFAEPIGNAVGDILGGETNVLKKAVAHLE